MEAQTKKRNLAVPIALSVGITVLMSLLLWSMGRIWWCKQGDMAIFIKEVWGSSHTSQHLLDPYVFTHILHGVAFCLILAALATKLAIEWRFVIAVLAEAGWELLENSSFIIEKYRANTASFDYFGDSIVNSIFDIVCCGLGFWVSYKLRFWWALALFLFTELVLLFWIHDSLILNIIMLIWPIDAVKHWQMGA